ncbi:hypothetical protein BV25DRAFT_1867513 [Artomyces pyxidatus]|uniref:Uncharacterized protein n=1 Tax=Artomyces pyxidatus TaxID=48021 RepID=A0ACB8TH36_9AGAM|nr:hypothetical protein BV25DRAFT_1867513 [Artomyces pyxidatus]
MTPEPSSPSPLHHSPLVRKPSDPDDSSFSEFSPSRSFLRPPKGAAFPDPSHFPDPYRTPHHYLSSTPPTLSSGGSSTASTRSSAYTSSGSALASGDYGMQFQVASGEDDEIIGVGITSDEVVHLLHQENQLSSSGSLSRVPIDQTRWSQSYSASLRSRSSLVRSNSGSGVESTSPKLKPKPSYDLSWQAVDERDEVDLTSEGETEETDLDGEDDPEEDEHEEREEERTAAIVIAEEGRGLIVRGEGAPVGSLQVQTGTTHLLVGSSTTPSALPSFLTNTLPHIGSTLLALDISANFLGALPPALESCVNLEELNVSSNPLRALPLFVARLTSLRVLIADSTGITTLPPPLSSLEKLHTLSIRRNKMYSLPSWFCLLPSLETLLVDGNPFQGPWKALMDPLLSKEANSSSLHPPSSPMVPLPSANTTIETDSATDTDADELSDSPAPESDDRSPEDEDTITPARAMLGRAATSPAPFTDGNPPARGITRTRTTPNRAYFERSKGDTGGRTVPTARTVSQHQSRKVPDSGYFGDHEVRRMKSAGELRAAAAAASRVPPSPSLTAAPPPSGAPSPSLFATAQPISAASPSPSASSTFLSAGPTSLYAPASPSLTQSSPSLAQSPPPPRAALSHYVASASSSNLLSSSDISPPRFASLGVAAGSNAPNARPPLDKSLWDRSSQATSPNPASASRNVLTKPPMSPASKADSPESLEKLAQRQRSRSSRKDKDKDKDKDKEQSGRWGFLKKMSMSKLRSDSPGSRPSSSSRPSTAMGRPGATPLAGVAESSSRSISSPMVARVTTHIDVRFSSTGSLGVELPQAPPAIVASPSIVEPEPEPQSNSGKLTLVTSSTSASPNMLSVSPTFLSPATATPRGAKRRSFLPIDGPPTLSIPVPSPAAFLPGVTATDGTEDDQRSLTPSPVSPETIEQQQRREEDRAREACTRALRSVMAYLRDMNDLSLSQQMSTTSVYGSSNGDLSAGAMRTRRPTIVENGRVVSDASQASSPASIATSRSGASDQLRSMESIVRLRSLSSTNSVSIATTDSGGSGSGEERKYKDDSAKRAMIMREIVETERTYVKGLQELVDIYIKPGSAPVNLLGGVSSTKETVVPAAERKIVFNGIDALFSFHKESFLPALEFAATPVMKSASVLATEDVDGLLSAAAAKAIANVFVSHAAFMRMYSTYINNFDQSVQRIKHWISDRPATGSSSPPSNLSPNGTSQIVGLGLAISGITAPGAAADVLAASSTNTAPLSSSQRKRIKSYLKRCRLNPRHSQLNLEGYLLLPVQRIPRYRLLLEELGRSTPPSDDYVDPLDKALTEISSLATNMNEGKRESESRRKLVQWQAKIRGKFPSPLVQPHRRLIMDGPLLLTRVVRKATIAFEVIDSSGHSANVQVECLSPEQTPRSLVGILCNDLLVLCRDPSEGKDPHSPVDLWAVLRMQTLPQPASIVHGNVLRLVDNKAILYFEASSTSVALTWFRAINLHIPTSKS